MEDKICPMLECKECMWYRPFLMTNKEKGITKHKMRCSIEVILEWIPDVQGRLEGMQQSTEETRNRVDWMFSIVRRGALKSGRDAELGDRAVLRVEKEPVGSIESSRDGSGS